MVQIPKALAAASRAAAPDLTSTLAKPGATDPVPVTAAVTHVGGPIMSTLGALLTTRTDRLTAERTRSPLITMVGLPLAGWCGIGVWWQTRRDVRFVVERVSTIAEGDLGDRLLGGQGRIRRHRRRHLRSPDPSGEHDRELTQAQEADRVVAALVESLRSVAETAQIISRVADQTKLLALNASIEAARGRAGLGQRFGRPRHGRPFAPAKVRDISVLGLQLGADTAVAQTGDSVHADLTLGVARLRLTGRVVRAAQEGQGHELGLEFVNVSATDNERLRAHLAALTEDFARA
ncbi:MAG TPA: PilZ domain-containing protein [Kineosporiaceae bacterium]|nr:PilZ domain-containing protein [Kineosporiaceae bacterium]